MSAPENPTPPPDEPQEDRPGPSAMWHLLVSQSALPAMLQQARFQDEVLEAHGRTESGRWEFDADAAQLGFEGVGFLPAQVLGTLADADGTWLWSWANESLPEPVTYAAARLRDELARLPAPTPLAEDVTRRIGVLDAAIVGAWNTEADGYYIAPTGGGATVVFLVKHPELAKRRIPYERLPLVVAAIIEQLPVDHQILVEGWRRSEPQGIRFEEGPAGSGVVTAHAEGLPPAADGTPDPAEGATWRFEFDEQGRIAGIGGSADGAATP
ncbi:DUF6882 domain-containing protein [Patulibacter sp. S7RM1-6]